MTIENTESESTVSFAAPTQPRRRGRWSWALLAVPFVAALGVGAVARAQPSGGPGMGMGMGMMGGEHGPGMGRHVEEMLKAVSATDAQKAQIKTIWDGAKPQMKSLHDEHEQLRMQIGAALGAPTVDAAKIEQLRKQSMQTMDKMSSVTTQAFVATANVLTPDQRKLALAKVQERRDEHREDRQDRQERRGGRHGDHDDHGGPKPPAAPAASPVPGAK